jgi:hypothetical protein
MKIILLLLMFVSGGINACAIGPTIILDPNEIGFVLLSKQDLSCSTCDIFGAMSKLEYKGRPFSHSILYVYEGLELMSKAVISTNENSQMVKFSAILSNKPGITYDLVVEYGASSCPSYSYMYRSI